MSGRCDRCQKKIRIYHGLVGLHCVWCHLEVSSGATPPASALGPLLKAALSPPTIRLASPMACAILSQLPVLQRALQYQTSKLRGDGFTP